jgi:hypothetical protein
VKKRQWKERALTAELLLRTKPEPFHTVQMETGSTPPYISFPVLSNQGGVKVSLPAMGFRLVRNDAEVAP